MGTNGSKESLKAETPVPVPTAAASSAMGHQRTVPVAPVLSSWKEIAAYLGRSVRTVQRMEAELALPVRRPRGHARSSVIAIPSELDEWLKTFSPQRTEAFAAASRKPATGSNHGTRVLVVDDQELTLYALSKSLQSRGYEVTTAQSARHALRMAFFADVVLLDVNLPEIHGFEVLRRLRTGLTTSHIPVICMSASYGPEGAAPLALQLGAKRFLAHPIAPDALDLAIHDAVSQSLARPEARLAD